MRRANDVQMWDVKLERMQALVRAGGVSRLSKARAPICERNRDLIIAYDRNRALAGLRAGTRVAIMRDVLDAARMMGKEFDGVGREDVERLIAALGRRVSPMTLTTFKMNVRKFFKWLRYGDGFERVREYPEEVRWITTRMRRSEKRHVQRVDLWTEEEERRLIAAAAHPRDRALLAVLTETGARVGELNLCIRDVYQDEFGFLLHIDGKTGEREPRVIYAGPAIAEWLNVHPDRDNPDAPLFPKHKAPEKAIGYAGICEIIRRAARRAGLGRKKCNPHIFRHSRATQLAEQGYPEQVIKSYLGWTPDSAMLNTYSHLSSHAANAFMLEKQGIAKAAEVSKPALRVQACAMCHAQNGPETKFCRKCGRPLHLKAALEYNQAKNEAYEERLVFTGGRP